MNFHTQNYVITRGTQIHLKNRKTLLLASIVAQCWPCNQPELRTSCFSLHGYCCAYLVRSSSYWIQQAKRIGTWFKSQLLLLSHFVFIFVLDFTLKVKSEKKTRHFQKFAMNKKSTFFVLSSWNFVKMKT